MGIKTHFILLLVVLLLSCKEQKNPQDNIGDHWSIEALNENAMNHLDSTKRDELLYNQDIETYQEFGDFFQSLPLNKSPFPVAEYDYAVSYIPFSIQFNQQVFKGVRIGECRDPDCETIIDKMTLLVLSNDINTEENTLVDSRNYPYLTAQGYFLVNDNEYDWVFSASPDGYSILILNMKLFDLRFGETIIIYPQEDNSFLYNQIKDSPNNYENFEVYKEVIINLQ